MTVEQKAKTGLFIFLTIVWGTAGITIWNLREKRLDCAASITGYDHPLRADMAEHALITRLQNIHPHINFDNFQPAPEAIKGEQNRWYKALRACDRKLMRELVFQ